jgi:hypothetical protein
MADPTNMPTIVSATRDPNLVTNEIFVGITDGTTQVTVTGTALDVNASNASVHVDDAAFTVGTDSVVASGYLADETTPDSVDEGDIGLARMTLDRKQLMRVVGSTDANRWEVDASGFGQVDLAAVSVTAVPISKDGSANSELNPIWVQQTETLVSGEEVHDYDTASAIASDASDSHDYTVAGTTFFLHAVDFSASGGMKIEVLAGPVAGLVPIATRFTDKGGPLGDQIVFNPPVEVPVTSTGTVRVTRTNRQGQAIDLYSTIMGRDV